MAQDLCPGTNSKLSLMVVLDALEGAGSQFSVLQLLSGLDRNIFSICLVVRKARGAALSDVPGDLEVVELGTTKGYRALIKLVKLLQARQPDLVWSALYFNNIITAAAKGLARCNCKVVLSEHSSLTEELDPGRRPKAILFKPLMKYLYPGADRIIAVSNGVAQSIAIELNIQPAKITTIYNAVDIESVRTKATQAVPEIFWHGDPVFVAVGRLHEQKDYPTLIRAVALLSRPVKILIIGEGPLKQELLVMCRELGVEKQIEFVGYKKNPFKYMARARALVLSSQYEGFGRVIVEAMACGRPVISTRCPEGPGEIIIDGENGLLVPVGDSVALAAAMDQLADDHELAQRLGAAAYTRASDYSVEIAASKYTDLFLGLFK